MVTGRSGTHCLHSSVSPGLSFNNVQCNKHSFVLIAVVTVLPTTTISASVCSTRRARVCSTRCAILEIKHYENMFMQYTATFKAVKLKRFR